MNQPDAIDKLLRAESLVRGVRASIQALGERRQQAETWVCPGCQRGVRVSISSQCGYHYGVTCLACGAAMASTRAKEDHDAAKETRPRGTSTRRIGASAGN